MNKIERMNDFLEWLNTIKSVHSNLTNETFINILEKI